MIECLNKRGDIKSLQGDYEGALLDYNNFNEIKLMIDKING